VLWTVAEQEHCRGDRRMTRAEELQTDEATTDAVRPRPRPRPRRAGKHTRRRRQTVSETVRPTHQKAGQRQGQPVDRITVVQRRRPETQPVSDRLNETRTGPSHRVRPSQRHDTTRSTIAVSNSTYAGAKFTGGAPSAAHLPLPPPHWLIIVA